MDHSGKMAWLRRYRESLQREQLLTEEIEQLGAQARRVTRAIGDRPQKGGDGCALPRAVERLEKARQELKKEVSEGQAQRAEIAQAIERLQNPLHREILTRRYILGQRWEKIAAERGCNLRWIFRIHRAAVEKLAIESQ